MAFCFNNVIGLQTQRRSNSINILIKLWDRKPCNLLQKDGRQEYMYFNGTSFVTTFIVPFIHKQQDIYRLPIHKKKKLKRKISLSMSNCS